MTRPIIQWRTDTKRTLYLCSETGLPLDQVETRLHVPDLSFSAGSRGPREGVDRPGPELEIVALHVDSR
jgi:hypothetical protein